MWNGGKRMDCRMSGQPCVKWWWKWTNFRSLTSCMECGRKFRELWPVLVMQLVVDRKCGPSTHMVIGVGVEVWSGAWSVEACNIWWTTGHLQKTYQRGRASAWSWRKDWVPESIFYGSQLPMRSLIEENMLPHPTCAYTCFCVRHCFILLFCSTLILRCFSCYLRIFRSYYYWVLYALKCGNTLLQLTVITSA